MAAEYNLRTERVDGEQRAIFTHAETGVRVVCREPEGAVWRVEIWPPASMGDNPIKRIGFDPSPAAAQERAKGWMADHPNGVPETYPVQRSVARADGFFTTDAQEGGA